MHLVAQITNAGPVGTTAQVSFDAPMQVVWNSHPLTNMTMSDFTITSGSATIDQTAVVEIVNTQAFTNFTNELYSSTSFQWQLVSSVTVTVAGIKYNGITMSKNVSMPGMNQLGFNVSGFDLVSTDPNQGASVVVTTTITNPSPFSVVLGDVAVGTSKFATIISVDVLFSKQSSQTTFSMIRSLECFVLLGKFNIPQLCTTAGCANGELVNLYIATVLPN